ADLHLWADLTVQPGEAGAGAPLVRSVARQAGEGPGLPGFRLFRALRRRASRNGAMAEAGEAEVSRGRRPGPRKLPSGFHRDAAGKKPRETAGPGFGVDGMTRNAHGPRGWRCR